MWNRREHRFCRQARVAPFLRQTQQRCKEHSSPVSDVAGATGTCPELVQSLEDFFARAWAQLPQVSSAQKKPSPCELPDPLPA